MNGVQEIFQKAASGASYLFFLQFLRLFVFFLNRETLRTLSADVYGIGAVQMQLLLTIVLFISRESFRRACQRIKESSSNTTFDTIVSLSWIVVYFGIGVGILASLIFVWTFGLEMVVSHQEYVIVVVLFCVAAIVELLIEPMYNIEQYFLVYHGRVFTESLAAVLKVLVTYIVIVVWEYGVVGFGIAQLAHSFFLLLGHAWFFFMNNDKMSKISLMPKSIRSGWFSEVRDLVGSYFSQTIVKFLLQEGEKIVLVLVHTAFDQGIYGLVSNLGSLAARLIFQPLEETTFTICAKLSTAAEAERKDTLEYVARLMQILLKTVILIGLIILAFGPMYAYSALRILYGTQWSDFTNAPSVFALYCLYISLCAVNGVTEAYVQAASTPVDLIKHNAVLFSMTLIFLACAVVGTSFLGTMGLVWASCISMGVRALMNLKIMRGNFSSASHTLNIESPLNLLAAVPSRMTLGVAVGFSSVAYMCAPRAGPSVDAWYTLTGISPIKGIICGAACGTLMCLVIGMVLERKHFRDVVALRRGSLVQHETKST